jgi:Hydantoinase B/oxoprolinase
MSNFPSQRTKCNENPCCALPSSHDTFERGIRRRLAARGDVFRPGDVIMHNDLYGGASHGPDVAFCVPVFDDDELLGFTKPYSSDVANAPELRWERRRPKMFNHCETSKRAVHSAEYPSERERDRYSRIRLFFDGVAQCPLEGTGGLGGAVDGLTIEVLGGIRHFTGLFLGISKSTVEIGARSRGLWHVNAPLESGLWEINAQK